MTTWVIERMIMELDFTSHSEQETIELGRKIGSKLKGSEIIGLIGPLGSAKTHLIKGIAAGAGSPDFTKQVNSPTFVIVNEYFGRLDIYHIDAYRIASADEFDMIGFDDFCYPNSVVLIEWADKVQSSLKSVDYIKIELTHLSQSERKIHITNAPAYVI